MVPEELRVMKMINQPYKERLILKSGGESSYRPNYLVQSSAKDDYSLDGQRGIIELQEEVTEDLEEQSVTDKPSTLAPGEEQRIGIDIDLMMKQLWTSATLLDNLVTVFGYIDKKPWPGISLELYRSLQSIKRAVKVRRILPLKLIRSLKKMSFAQTQQQYIVLFTGLKDAVFIETRGAVVMWLDALVKHEVNMSKIVRPNGNNLVVDILSNIELKDIEDVSYPVQTLSSSTESMKKQVIDILGLPISKIFAGIQDGSIRLTQSLVAVLLLHLPFDRLTPEVEESLRYLVDVLQTGLINVWERIENKAYEVINNDPFSVIKGILMSIAEDKAIHSLIREAATTCHPYVLMPSFTSINPNLQAMNHITTQPSLNIRLLLTHVSNEEFPPDIIDSKKIIANSIITHELDITRVDQGFNRFLYETPIDLLIALTSRIRRRLGITLRKEVMDAVKALHTFLVFKKRAASWGVYLPKDLLDVMGLLEAAGSPSLPKSVRGPQQELLQLLPQENIDWSKTISFLELQGCSSPRRCLVKFLRTVVHNNLLSGTDSLFAVVQLLAALDSDGEPMDPITTFTTTTTTSTTAPGTTRNSSPAFKFPSQNLGITFPTSTSVTSTTTTKPHLDLRPPPNNLKDLYSEPTSPINKFLGKKQLGQILGVSFNMGLYKTRGELLLAILKQALTVKAVQQNIELYQAIIMYLIEIEAMTSNDIDFLRKAQEESHLERLENFPNYKCLAVLLENTTEDKDNKKEKVKAFLERPDLPSVLGPWFHPESIATKGQLLKEVLRYALVVDMVQHDEELFHAIRFYLDRVITSGMGSQAVNWILGMSRSFDLNQLIMTVKTENMTKEELQCLDNIYTFFLEEFDSREHLAGFNIFKYSTYGELMWNILKHLTHNSLIDDELYTDILSVLPYISIAGSGAKSLEPINMKMPDIVEGSVTIHLPMYDINYTPAPTV